MGGVEDPDPEDEVIHCVRRHLTRRVGSQLWGCVVRDNSSADLYHVRENSYLEVY